MSLVSAIFKAIEKQNPKAEMNCRQMNAVISAATLIVNEFAKAHVPAVPGMGIRAWLQSDDTGTSSLFMASFLFPQEAPAARPATPRDGDDFGRCLRFVEAVPGARDKLPDLAIASPAWRIIAGQWDKIEKSYHADGVELKNILDAAANA